MTDMTNTLNSKKKSNMSYFLSGFMLPPLPTWQLSPYIMKILNEFEKIHKQNGDNCISALGILSLSKNDFLYPEYTYNVIG